jgi:GrpB-like predicted nucleotidyltransferase (UPF0157 family)
MNDDDLQAITVGALKELNRPVRIADHDPAWPLQFNQEAAKIRAALGQRALAIEHVGSTSVTGLPAKPVIDIVLVVADSSREEDYAAVLTGAGFQLRVREPAWFEHRMFESAEENVNLHVFSTGCPEIKRMLTFRDWMRSHADDCERYASLKRELARRDWKYMQNYADAKSAVIGEILSKALRFDTIAEQ